MSKCIIIAAGPVSDYGPAKSLFQGGEYVICADGGVRHLKPLSVRPDIIVGDLDSVQGDLPEGVKVFLSKREKDETDTILAIQHALAKGCREIVIIGATGGSLDHTVANFSALLYIANRGGRGVLFDARTQVHLLTQGELRLKRREGFYVSVFPFCGAARGVTETGMKYRLSNADLTAEFPVGISNEFQEEEAVISVDKGPLLIILSKR